LAWHVWGGIPKAIEALVFWEICDEIEKDCHCLTFYVLSCFEQTKQLVKQLPCRKLVRSKFEKKDVLIDRYQDSKGRWRFKGNSALKGSQTYPAPFGREAFHGAVGSMKMCFFNHDGHLPSSSLVQVQRQWALYAACPETELGVDRADQWDDAERHGSHMGILQSPAPRKCDFHMWGFKTKYSFHI
jgi:hypothetical protein